MNAVGFIYYIHFHPSNRKIIWHFSLNKIQQQHTDCTHCIVTCSVKFSTMHCIFNISTSWHPLWWPHNSSVYHLRLCHPPSWPSAVSTVHLPLRAENLTVMSHLVTVNTFDWASCHKLDTWNLQWLNNLLTPPTLILLPMMQQWLNTNWWHLKLPG